MTLSKHVNFDQPRHYLPAGDEIVPQQPSSTLSFKDVMLMIYRRKWVALTLFAAIFLTAAVVTMLMPSIYVARAKVLLKRERVNTVVSVNEGTNTDIKPQISEETLNSEIEILKSTTLLREVLRSTGLHKQILNEKGLSHLNEEMALEIGVAYLKRDLDCQIVPKSNIIQVSYESKEPRLAAEIVNVLCQQYVDRHLEVHENKGIFSFFQKQADALHDTLRATAAELQYFEAENGLIAPEQQRTLFLQQLADYESRLNTARAGAEAAAQQVEFLEQQLTAEPNRIQAQTRQVSGTVFESLTKELASLQVKYEMLLQEVGDESKLNNRELRSLKARIAQVEQAIQREENSQRQEVTGEINRSMMDLSAELTRARFKMIGFIAEEKELVAAINQLKARLNNLESAALSHEALKRRWQLNQNNYLLYAKKQEEARISEALDREKVANVSIIDPASVPLSPVRPNRKLYITMGFFLASLVSLGTAFGLSFFDGMIHTGSDLERQLNVPLIVTIPEGQWPPELLLEDAFEPASVPANQEQNAQEVF
jgi:uncharacterized protein involved in exopolysaccharide biosynthesis